MSASPVVVFQSLSQPPAASVIEETKKQDGLQRVISGSKMEDRSTVILCTGACFLRAIHLSLTATEVFALFPF
jgi:hypothetical protein